MLLLLLLLAKFAFPLNDTIIVGSHLYFYVYVYFYTCTLHIYTRCKFINYWLLSNAYSIFPISPVSGVGRSIGWLVDWLAAWCICVYLEYWIDSRAIERKLHIKLHINIHPNITKMKTYKTICCRWKQMICPWFYYYCYCCCWFLNAIFLFHWTVFLRIKKGLISTELLQYIQWQLEIFPKKTNDSQFRVNQFQAYRNRGNHMHFRYVCDSNAGKWKSWNKKTTTTNKRNPFTHTHIFRNINTHMWGCIWIAGGSINGVGSAKIDRSQTG